MTTKEDFGFEAIIFDYIDEFKFLFFPDQWSSVFLEYSKNEILALLFLYRNKTANMTEIAVYINAPLNTTTGVVGRLEKKLMVERIRENKDRRVVNIVLTKTAEEFIDHEKKLIKYYFEQVYKELTEAEKVAALSIFKKVNSVMSAGRKKVSDENSGDKKVRRIVIE